MSFGVGITMMKLTNKRSSRAGSRHTGKLGGVAYEALEERRGRDADIDRSRTPQNVYQGYRRAAELVAAMNGEAAAYSEERQRAGGRALRSTAAIGFATIVKPDGDFIMSLSEADRDRFFQDSNEILDGILGSANIRSRVRHKDEGADHEHTFRMGFAPSGKLETAFYFKPQLWRRINVEFPEAMRQRGWDVADCDVYDPDRADDPEYMAGREAKRAKYGRGSADYKNDQAAKKKADADRMKIAAAIELADAKAQAQAVEQRAADLTAREAAVAVQEAQVAADRVEVAKEREAAQEARRAAQDAAQMRDAFNVTLNRRHKQDAARLRERERELRNRERDVAAREADVARKEAAMDAMQRARYARQLQLQEQQQREREQQRQRDGEAIGAGLTAGVPDRTARSVAEGRGGR